MRIHVTNVSLTNESLRSSVNPSRYQALILFSRAFAIARRAESETHEILNHAAGTIDTSAVKASKRARITQHRGARDADSGLQASCRNCRRNCSFSQRGRTPHRYGSYRTTDPGALVPSPSRCACRSPSRWSFRIPRRWWVDT